MTQNHPVVIMPNKEQKMKEMHVSFSKDSKCASFFVQYAQLMTKIRSGFCEIMWKRHL